MNPNPYPLWFFEDENGKRCGPYESERIALYELLRHIQIVTNWRKQWWDAIDSNDEAIRKLYSETGRDQ